MIRYQEYGHGAARSNGQDGEEAEREKQEKVPPASYRHRMSDGLPDVRQAPATGCPVSTENLVPHVQKQIVRSLTRTRRLDLPEPPDDRRLPEIRCHYTREESSEDRRPPDIRSLTNDWTSGNHRTSNAACVQPEGFRPMYPPLTA